MVAYNIYSLAFGGLSAIASILTEVAGPALTGTCFISPTLPSIVITGLCDLLNFVVTLVTIILSIRLARKESNMIMTNHILVVLAFMLTWGLLTIIDYAIIGISDEDTQRLLLEIECGLGGLSGAAITIARLSNRKLIKIIKKSLTENKKDDMLLTVTVCDNSLWFNEFFNIVTKNTIKQIVYALYLYLKNESFHCNFQDISPVDFTEIETINLDTSTLKQDDQTLDEDVLPQQVLVKVYAPYIFSNIRGIHSSVKQQIAESFHPNSNKSSIQSLCLNEGGRSDSFLLSSYNGLYVVKNVTSEELNILFHKLLHHYYFNLIENPKSRIVRVLGLYSLPCLRESVILMEKTIKFPEESWIFDIKGSTVSRKVNVLEENPCPKGVVLKDQNFLETFRYLEVSYLDKQIIFNAFKKDVELLRQLQIMDYSILIGVTEYADRALNRYEVISDGKKYIYSVSIIDILQQYNFRKKVEHIGKSIISPKDAEISSVEANQYASRILKMLDSILKVTGEVFYY